MFVVCSTAGEGAAGNASLALREVLTSTPWPAFAQGACAGAREAIVNSFAGAAMNPFSSSNNVSVCATIGITGTS